MMQSSFSTATEASTSGGLLTRLDDEIGSLASLVQNLETRLSDVGVSPTVVNSDKYPCTCRLDGQIGALGLVRQRLNDILETIKI